jgi:hypothetical protein
VNCDLIDQMLILIDTGETKKSGCESVRTNRNEQQAVFAHKRVISHKRQVENKLEDIE